MSILTFVLESATWLGCQLLFWTVLMSLFRLLFLGGVEAALGRTVLSIEGCLYDDVCGNNVVSLLRI